MKNASLSITEAVLDRKLDQKFAEAFAEYDDKNREYRDQILTGLDGVMKELETMREDGTIGNYQVSEKFSDHEKRIKKLEIQTH